jgi:hypothetical protein
MTPTDYSERIVEHEGWQIRLTTHKLGDTWHTKADNVSPGAWLARMSGATKEEAEEAALSKARHLLGRTKRTAV